jgi:hypothetical protein
LLAALAFAPAAYAQSDVDRENAQSLYKSGNDARDAGDAKAALARYKAAYALVQTPVIAVALGKAQMGLGQLIEARQTLLGVERIAPKPNESALTASARAEAKTLAAQTEPRIPAVTLKIAMPRGAPAPTVTIDDVPIPEAALDVPRKVNPGGHVAVATSGAARSEKQFTLAEGAAQDVALDYPTAASPSPPAPAQQVAQPAQSVPAASAPPPPVPAANASPSPPDSGAADAASASGPSRVPAYVALGVGAAGVVVTAVFGALALGSKSSLDGVCGGGEKTSCPPSSQSDISAMHVDSILSDVGLGVGIVGLGVGGVLLLLNRGASAPSSKPTAASVEPWVSAGALGMRGRF